ncbi:tRNA ligase class II core domain (G, H, P, S and T) [Anaerofustis stercorihominis DSM 17244]|uniref:tRNA ligase class II core domain (G, H, P, S and T) n=1 Tax=Anaerofustis stercorihominis DSM 17244 TaxID=445971 RepID=B1CBX6_9FIRM|nr:ATP phosphoribosyltransferase regulatory subunit [Anaerofustis stercorihominis]EDS71773.1 tRNA ligase class II core domain (G, H, P, S and T) [Anaerofustis stercorihominis DSM 17244]
MLHREDNTQKKYAFLKDTLSMFYKKYGYEQITIPMFMPYELYKKFNFSHQNEELKLIDGNGNILVIRADATFHVLKTVSTLKSKENEKYFYEAKVFRNMNKDYTLDEINQTGVECFLKESDIVDSDIIALAINSLFALGIKDIRLDLSHADFVYALIEEIDEIKKDEVEIVHKFIEQKNRDDLISYLDKKNVDIKYKDKLIDICMLFGDFEEVINKARTIAINDKMNDALDKIEGVYNILKLYDLDKYVYLDLGFTNAMNYYSGIMFKVYSIDAGGEIINGGRYDRLARKIAGRSGACGFSQNLDLTAQILSDNNDDFFSVDYLIYSIKEDIKKGIDMSKQLRAKGYNVSLMEGKNFKVVDRKKNRNLKREEIVNLIGE